jgi:hypothetical protein
VAGLSTGPGPPIGKNIKQTFQTIHVPLNIGSSDRMISCSTLIGGKPGGKLLATK